MPKRRNDSGGERSQSNGSALGDVVIGGIEKGMVYQTLDRAIARDSRYFRLTAGQRKALGLKPSK